MGFTIGKNHYNKNNTSIYFKRTSQQMDTKKILAIDDYSINNKLLKASLRGKNYDITTKESAKEAFEWLEANNTPNTILLDIMMPEMDGIEMLSILKSDNRWKHIPVIMVTAKTESEHIKETLELGAHDYIKKPIDFTELKVKINVALTIDEQRKNILKYKSYYDIHQGMLHAERILRSIAPDTETLKKRLPNSFIINLPKHIIGGDFHWIQRTSNSIHIGVFDCTGHGVPAAMLSVMGQLELYNIYKKNHDIDTANLFNQLSSRFANFLNQSSDTYTPYEGMDASFCTIIPEANLLNYVLAKRMFVLVRKGNTPLIIDNKKIPAYASQDGFNLYLLLGDRHSIGRESENFKFNMHSLQLKYGDRVYLFSDGITDQLGIINQKRLKRKIFAEKMMNIQGKLMSQQKSDVFKWFEEWKGENEQTDDILVVAFEYTKDI